jgi:integrase
MACIRKRRGKFTVDYRDATGRRRWITCESKGEAIELLDVKRKEVKLLAGSLCANPDITVKEYFDLWIEKVAHTNKPLTAESYRGNFRLHILPEFGGLKVQKLHRTLIKKWLVEKLGEGYAKGTIRLLIKTFRSMLSEAVEDGIIPVNPASKMGRNLKVEGKESNKGAKDIKAFSRDQLSRFLENAHPRWYPYFLFMARTGLRLGESLALEVSDLDFDRRVVIVSKQNSKGEIQTPKDGESREVDLSTQLVEVLRIMIAGRRRECFEQGKQMPTLLFPTENGGPLKSTYIVRAIERTLKKAGIGMHFSIHCFRHTFASQLLQQGKSVAYVQRMLGHSSIKQTADTYGRWLPAGDKDAIDCLDEPIPARAVQEG